MNQSTIEKKTLEFDATHSWNGYSYQGKIALIVILDLIINKIKNKESLEPYKLEFERLEDFSILKDDKHVQIHQVKSYGTESLSRYKDAIWLLLGKSVYKDYSSINKSYLHAADVITSNKGVIDSTEKLLEVIETYDKPSDSKSKQIASPLELYNYVRENGLKENAFSKFKLYTYSNGEKYCSLFNVNEEVKERIREYYICINKSTKLEEKGLMERQIEYCYNFLLGLIDDHINKRHINRQLESELHFKEISFIEFIKILDTEYDKLPKSYYVYYLKNKLIQIFNDFYSSQKEWIEDQLNTQYSELEFINECHEYEAGLEKIMGILKQIYSDFDDDDFLLFCNRITPHVLIKEEDGFLQVDELIITEFIKSPWISTLMALQKEIDEENLLIKVNKQDYLPSTISHTYTIPGTYTVFQRRQAQATIEATISDIVVKIINNKNIYKELYKIDNIITGNINASLKNYIHKVTDNKDINNDKEGYHIMDIKNVELIDLEKTLTRRDEQ